jgi:hypothetical protein
MVLIIKDRIRNQIKINIRNNLIIIKNNMINNMISNPINQGEIEIEGIISNKKIRVIKRIIKIIKNRMIIITKTKNKHKQTRIIIMKKSIKIEEKICLWHLL